MTTCRDVISDAFGTLGGIAFGGQPSADELDGGLAALGKIILDLHGARCRMIDVDVTADYLASENERVRVQGGSTVVVTLPNSILSAADYALEDTGGRQDRSIHWRRGSNSIADGCLSRPPHDGARVEIVGATQGLYFYRSDTNAWVLADSLAIDGPTPLNKRYDNALAALVAEQLCGPMNVDPTPILIRRIARAYAALLGRPIEPGVRRELLYL